MSAIAGQMPIPLPQVQQARSLAESLKSGGRESAEQTAAEFESLFVSQLVAEMRKTVGEDGLFPGDGSDVYGGMFDLYLGRHLADSGRFGIAEIIQNYIQRDAAA